MSEPSAEIRAADADRDRVAQQLQEHFAQGRLDSEELSSRIARAHTARSIRELDQLTSDLPAWDLAELPRVPAKSRKPRGLAVLSQNPVLLIPWMTWGGVNALCFAIWLLAMVGSGGTTYPWFLWVAVPWGIVMAFITLGTVLVRRSGEGLDGGG
ncbi:DUF1707 domain-containing protein [Salinactinospora qingdaonensis]|uniref:DUF1707 domain-containing protein n=1 Tax=Salinactinospora qingdaonensis TaxID=702744 RepID=A0ABP7GCP5_9ACTN